MGHSHAQMVRNISKVSGASYISDVVIIIEGSDSLNEPRKPFGAKRKVQISLIYLTRCTDSVCLFRLDAW